ncbi:MAG: hypothetical protein HY814_06665 [Candidatus Riflebacteria bacterium]|nr:hypothetical protein [Candidatus Riflebacteria bacterium]
MDWVGDGGRVFAHGPEASFRADRSGTAVIRCTAGDSQGRTGESSRTIWVLSTVPGVAIVAPAAGSSFLPVDPIEFRGTVHDGTDPQVDASDLERAIDGISVPGHQASLSTTIPLGLHRIEVGTGPELETRVRTTGAHTVTLSIRDLA